MRRLALLGGLCLLAAGIAQAQDRSDRLPRIAIDEPVSGPLAPELQLRGADLPVPVMARVTASLETDATVARRATHAARLQKTPGLARDRSAVCCRKRRELADAAAGSAVEACRRHCDRRNRYRYGRREARGLRSPAGRDRHPRRARSDPRRSCRSQRSSRGRSLHRRARAVSGFAGAAGGSGCQRRGGPPPPRGSGRADRTRRARRRDRTGSSSTASDRQRARNAWH